MVSIAKKGENYSVSLMDEHAEKLGLTRGQKYEISKVKDGLFVLYESESQPAKAVPKKDFKGIDQSIFSLLYAKNLSDRVEGRFEEFLTAEEKERFSQLIREKSIIPFKLNEQYKKAVYKTREEIEIAPNPENTAKESMARDITSSIKNVTKPKQSQPTPIQPVKNVQPIAQQPKSVLAPAPLRKPIQPLRKPDSFYSLDKNQFAVISNENEAKQLSQSMCDQIRRKEVMGTKSFDGDYFVIKSTMYEKQSPVVLSLIKGNSPISADEIAKTLRLDKQLVMAVCEFLKEEGEISERRKELYEFIK